VIVKWDLDPKTVWQMEERAERAGMSVPAWLDFRYRPVRSASAEAGDRTRSEVERLHGQGLSDAEIAIAVDRVQEHVARVRRGLGLKPNRRRA